MHHMLMMIVMVRRRIAYVIAVSEVIVARFLLHMNTKWLVSWVIVNSVMPVSVVWHGWNVTHVLRLLLYSQLSYTNLQTVTGIYKRDVSVHTIPPLFNKPGRT